MKRVMAGASVMIVALAVMLCGPGFGADTARLTEADWARLREGKLVKTVKHEGGTQGTGSGIGMFNHPPDLIWKAICALELYDEYVDATTVSVLLDEAAKDRVVAAGDKSADDVEKLFAGMKPGYVRKDPDGKWTVYSYQRNSFPWPINDRWVLLEISHNDASMTQTWHRLAGNFKEDFGSWHVEPVPDDPHKSLAYLDMHLNLATPSGGRLEDMAKEGTFIGKATGFVMGITMPGYYKTFENMAKDMAAGKVRQKK